MYCEVNLKTRVDTWEKGTWFWRYNTSLGSHRKMGEPLKGMSVDGETILRGGGIGAAVAFER